MIENKETDASMAIVSYAAAAFMRPRRRPGFNRSMPVNYSTLAPALVAAVILSACAPNQPPPLGSTPVASSGDRIISGPAPVPSAGSRPESPPDYTQVGRDPVPNFPDTGGLESPDQRPYGSY